MTTPAIRKLAGRFRSTAAKPPPSSQPSIFRNCTVVAAPAGASTTDGLTPAFIQRGADTIPAPYLASYTPHVGDMVRVEFCDGSPLIHGRVAGPPSF